MAYLQWWANSGEVALVAATAKTLLQVKAPANQVVLIRSIRILGKQAAGGTDAVVKVRMTRSTGSFGTFSAAAPGKQDPGRGETIQSVVGANATVEPTSPTDSGLWWEVQPQAGVEEFLPLTQPIVIPGGQAVNFEATSSGTPTLLITVGGEE